MIQYRRLTALLLGAWLGAGVLTDVAVTQNFQAVDRFLAAPGNPLTSIELNRVGRDKERVILRRNAGEENNWIFLNFERFEFVLGTLLFLSLVFGGRPQISLLAMSVGMLLIVGVQHLFLTPEITELGRRVDDLAKTDPEVARFWTLHGAYSGLEIVKLLVGFGFALRLSLKKKPDKDKFVREYEKQARTVQTVVTMGKEAGDRLG